MVPHVVKVVIRVAVKPGTRVSALAALPDGTWVAHTKARARDGRANRELSDVVAGHSDA